MASTPGKSGSSAYADGLVGAVGHADRAVLLRGCCPGLLLQGERESVEPMAVVTAPVRVAAQHHSLLLIWSRRGGRTGESRHGYLLVHPIVPH